MHNQLADWSHVKTCQRSVLQCTPCGTCPPQGWVLTDRSDLHRLTRRADVPFI